MNDQLEQRVSAIEKRNNKVALDKAWETSWYRRVLILLLTYCVMVVFFWFAQLSKPFINAIVPALAFTISTLSLDFFKRSWLRSKE